MRNINVGEREIASERFGLVLRHDVDLQMQGALAPAEVLVREVAHEIVCLVSEGLDISG